LCLADPFEKLDSLLWNLLGTVGQIMAGSYTKSLFARRQKLSPRHEQICEASGLLGFLDVSRMTA